MASNPVWYAGRCSRRLEHDKLVYMEVVAQLVNGEWTLLDNPQRLFSGTNEVEMRGDARTIKVSDWAAFTIAGKNKRDKFWQVKELRRLHRYVDLSDLGGVEQVQRRLAGEGIKTTCPSGSWVVRSGESDVLQLELKQANGIAHLSPSSGKASAFSFDSQSLVRIQAGDEDIVLYDLRPEGPPLTVYDWSPDEGFALRIARAIADAYDPRAKDVIAWLEEHAKKGQGLLCVRGTDLAALNDALRSGKLAKRLAADRELLRAFVDALVGDERVAEIFRECGERVAEQERGRARVKAEADVRRELEGARRQRLAALEAELAAVAEARRAQDDAAHAQRLRELNTDLEARRERTEAELERSVSARKAALEALVADLDARCKALGAEASKLKAEADDATEQAASRRAEENDVRARLDVLREQTERAASELAEIREQLATARQKSPLPLPPRAPGKALVPAHVGAALEASPLLSNFGKGLMAQFLALTLAGEVPVLCGPEVDDFLLVAELMFANGKSARLEADPTIITFEDLWLRPGTGVSTALGQALAIASGGVGQPRTTLAVVERAERSGARFWYPALVDRACRGDLPRRMLVCVTVADEDCEEAREILSRAVRLDVHAALAATSALAAIKDLADGAVGELDPGERVPVMTEKAAVIAPFASRLGVARALRAVRVASEAARLGTTAHSSSIVQLFLSDGGEASASSSQRSTIHA